MGQCVQIGVGDSILISRTGAGHRAGTGLFFSSSVLSFQLFINMFREVDQHFKEICRPDQHAGGFILSTFDSSMFKQTMKICEFGLTKTERFLS